MSSKLRIVERVAEGRLFVDHTVETLRNSLAAVPIEIAEMRVSYQPP
jgi:hypothetical protein